MTARACGHLRGASALGDLVQGKKTLARAIMCGSQGQAAQVCLRLVPALMVNSQHGPDDAFCDKPSCGGHRSVTQCRDYGFQTGRGLVDRRRQQTVKDDRHQLMSAVGNLIRTLTDFDIRIYDNGAVYIIGNCQGRLTYNIGGLEL